MTNRWPTLICLIAAAAQAGPNMISNGGFEEGPVQAIAAGWSARGEPAPPGYNLVDTVTRHSGSRSQFLRHCDVPGPLGWDQCGSVHQATPYNSVVPGRSYQVNAWIRKQGGANPAGWFVFGIQWLNNDSVTWEDKMPNTLPLNYDWTLVSYQVTAPASGFNGPPNRLVVWLTRHTDADVWYDDISVTDITAGPPTIARSPASISRTAVCGRGLPADTFTVQNSGGGTLQYSISSNQPWVSPSVTSGSSTGETDFISANYNLTGLAPGQYQASLTITDPAATNSPQTIGVSLAVYAPGDFDRDGDVDMTDFAHFQSCLSGDGVPQTLPACGDARLDDDGDVDQNDFNIFAGCLSGAHVPAPPDCCLPAVP